MADTNDTSPLLVEEGGVRQRTKPANSSENPTWKLPNDWNPDLPYGGKVYLARRKKPDPWWVTALEVLYIS